MGIQDLTCSDPAKSQQLHETEENKEPKLAEAAEQPKESSPVPGTWSPLLTNVCLCTALALSAYVCYRAYFHWYLSFLFLFVPPCLSTDVAKWTALASQPASTLPVSGSFGLQQIQVPSFNLTNAVRGVGWLPLLYYPPKHSLSVILDAQGLSFFRFHIPNKCADFNMGSAVCIMLSRQNEFVLAPPVLWTRMNDL